MGLSTKQVNENSLDWSQDQALEVPKIAKDEDREQDSKLAPLKCPRCDSENTKFCYFNNYSKSQPRHFCKACRRYWTAGGTLRDVPVGGCRKNKRLKTTSAHDRTTVHGKVSRRQKTVLRTPFDDQSDLAEGFAEIFLRPIPPDLGISSASKRSLLHEYFGSTDQPLETVTSFYHDVMNNPPPLCSISSTSSSSTFDDDHKRQEASLFTMESSAMADSWQEEPVGYLSGWDDIIDLVDLELKSA